MKFPSLASLVGAARSTLVRFPLVLLMGLTGAISIINETSDERWPAVSLLGISLLFGLSLFGERRGWSLPVRLAAQLAGLALLALYFISLPPNFDDIGLIRFSLFAIGTHLFAAFAPFTAKDDVEGFWRYNEILFLRALTAALFTLVLFGGLALALVSVDRLFHVTVRPAAYRDLFVLLGCVFATWFFLAGVPRDFASLRGGYAYPRGLKIFTQYVLLPLVSIYLIILYLYAGKIVATWEWPNGWVSALVIGLAIAGILSVLLLWPIREQEENRWIRRFSGGFYWALLPLTVLLLLAIWRRVSDYGITENRYFVIVIALWLAGIAIYFIISRRDNIKAIPITLCILAFAGTFGPWSPFEVSINSQVARLRELLTRQKILVEGKIVPVRAGDTVARATQDRVYSILYFLERRHALPRLAPMLPASRLDTMSVAALADALGMDDRMAYRDGVGRYSDPNGGPFEFRIDERNGADKAISVAGFAVVHYLQMSALTRDAQRFVVDGLAYTLDYDDQSGVLRVATDSAGSATFDVPAIVNRAAASALGSDSAGMAGAAPQFGGLPREVLTTDGAGTLRSRLVISHALVNRVDGRTRVSFYEGYLLIGGRR